MFVARSTWNPIWRFPLTKAEIGVAVGLTFFFFLIKCKNIIDQKGAGVQQYKEKGTKIPSGDLL